MATEKRLLIGLDIGATSIKACSLTVTKTGFTLSKLVEKKLRSYATENGSITDFGELVQGIIALIDESQFGFNSAAVALKGPSTVVRKINVYTEKSDELDEILRWIVNQYLDIDPEETTIDFTVLSTSERYNHASVLVTGAKKDTIVDFVSALQSSKLNPKVIEPEVLSLIRLYRGIGLAKKDVSMMVHIGFVGSLVLLINDGLFDFSKEITFGGRYCTEHLQETFSLTEDEAERVKLNPQAEKESSAIIKALDDIYMNDFTAELETVIKLYTLRGGKKVSRIFLSGGASLSFGLKEAIISKFSIPVDFLDPWRAITVPQELKELTTSKNRYSYAVAIGLAMHGKVF